MPNAAAAPRPPRTGTGAERPIAPVAGSTALLTDHYELTMLQAALASGAAHRRCVFEVFARRLPEGRRYGVVAGTGRLLDALEAFRFDRPALDHLADSRVVDDATLAFLSTYRFGGSVHGYAEGECFFPGSPLLVVEGSFAEAVLLEAAELAEANHHDELAADVWLDLMRLANQHELDPSRGAAWLPRARASQRRIGDPPARRVRVLYEQGFAHYLARDYAASERTYRAALALHEAVDGDLRLRGKLVAGLASTLEAAGQHAAARAAHEQADAATQAALGPDHPEVAAGHYNFATLLLVLGELDEAGSRLATALDIDTRALGPMHPMIGRIHVALVELAMRRGDFPLAIAHAQTATRIYRETLPDDDRSRVDAEVALGTARFYGGELEAALDAFLAARELQRRVPSPDPISLAVTACDIAETQTALARHDEASASFAEVDRLLARAPVRDRDLEARVLTGRANIALAQGDRRRALPLLEAAVDLRKQLPDDPLALAELQDALARARGG